MREPLARGGRERHSPERPVRARPGARGHSPELYAHLRDNPYDLVVLVGLSAALVFGLRNVPPDGRVVLIPGRAGDRSSWLPVYDEAFRRADVMLVPTETERKLVARRSVDDGRAVNVGFALRVSSLSAETDPVVGVDMPYVLVVGDWTSSSGMPVPTAGRLACTRPSRHRDRLRRPEARSCLGGPDESRRTAPS